MFGPKFDCNGLVSGPLLPEVKLINYVIFLNLFKLFPLIHGSTK